MTKYGRLLCLDYLFSYKMLKLCTRNCDKTHERQLNISLGNPFLHVPPIANYSNFISIKKTRLGIELLYFQFNAILLKGLYGRKFVYLVPFVLFQ